VEKQEDCLRAILESKQATPDEKFEALVDLAHLAGILLRETAESDENPNWDRPPTMLCLIRHWEPIFPAATLFNDTS
jgi:hypothetical protein